MATAPSFLSRLWAVIVPTSVQALGAVFLALLLLALTQSQSLLTRVGVTDTALVATQNQFHDRFDIVLRSPIASQLTLITFWAMVGLVAYLLCWGAYNILVEVRNEVTLSTSYTNRGHWRGPYETLALKAAAAVGLALIINSLWYGISFWIALSGPVISHPTLSTGGSAVLAALGLALQLYLVLVFIQLTFTPWYRGESFTDG